MATQDFQSAVERAKAVAAKLSQGSTPAAPPIQMSTSTVNYTNTINNGSRLNTNGSTLKRSMDDDDSIVGSLKKMAYSNTSYSHANANDNDSQSSEQDNGSQGGLSGQRGSSNGNTIFKPTQIYPEGVIINNEKILDILLPGNKVGFVIGKNGDMIRQLQDRANVKMVVIQQSSEVIEGQKQLRISGDPTKVDYAHQLVKDLLVEKEIEMLKYSQKGKPQNQGHSNHHGHHHHNNDYGSHNNFLEIPVSPQYIGLVIGKSGENIKRISQESGAKVSVDVQKTDASGNKLCQITSSNPSSVNIAADMIRDILNNAMNNKRGQQQGGEELKISVPQNKTGIVIGKGGETIRALKQQAGCMIELEKNSKGIFSIRGPADRVQYAQQLITEKIGTQVTVLSSTIQNNQPQTASSAYADPYSWAAAAQYGYSQMPAATSTPAATANPVAATAVGATQDQNAAWAAYYQYYSQMQQQMAQQQLPVNTAAATTPVAAQQTATPGIATQPAAVADASGAPAAEGQTEDYTLQWAQYYRYYGMIKEAEMYEAMAKQKKQATAAASP